MLHSVIARFRLGHLCLASIGALAAVLLLAPQAFAYDYSSTELPAHSHQVFGLAAAPDGSYWYVDINRLVHVADGQATEYDLGHVILASLVVAPDGEVFAEGLGGFFRVAPDGTIVDTLPHYPNGLAIGPDGNLWFTEQDSVVRYDLKTSTYTTFPVAVNSCPTTITAGADGALWYTESRFAGCPGSAIGRIDLDGNVTEHPIAAGADPDWITSAQDGALWFTELHTRTLGRMTIDGDYSEYQPEGGHFIGPAAGAADGTVWATQWLCDGDNCPGRLLRIDIRSGTIDVVEPAHPDVPAFWLVSNGGELGFIEHPITSDTAYLTTFDPTA